MPEGCNAVVPEVAPDFESTIKFQPGKFAVNYLQLPGYSIFQSHRMRGRFPGARDASVNLTESTLPDTINASRVISHKLKNVSQKICSRKIFRSNTGSQRPVPM